MATKTLSADMREKMQLESMQAEKPVAAPRGNLTVAEAANREWYPGLCPNCLNELTCQFPRVVDRPVRSCEEFDGVVDVGPSVSVPTPGPDLMFAVANREWYPGLCKTCEKLPGCTYPKPEGGVFNCDEFE